MNALTTARESLAGKLREAAPAGVTVWDHVPDDLTGRDVVLQPGPDYVVPADTSTGAEYVVTVECHLLISGETNATTHAAADELVAAVLPAVNGSRWVIAGMTRLDAFATSEWTTYGIAVTLQRYINL